jgi:hypothetical protein
MHVAFESTSSPQHFSGRDCLHDRANLEATTPYGRQSIEHAGKPSQFVSA